MFNFLFNFSIALSLVYIKFLIIANPSFLTFLINDTLIFFLATAKSTCFHNSSKNISNYLFPLSYIFENSTKPFITYLNPNSLLFLYISIFFLSHKLYQKLTFNIKSKFD